MEVCEICGSSYASYNCSNCRRRVCYRCFRQETGLCSICDDSRKRTTILSGDLSSIFGKLFPIGGALIFAGMFLMMIALILSLPAGSGAIVILPFFIGTVNETSAIILMIIFMIISLLFIFLPWILTPRKILKIFENISDTKTKETLGEEKAKGKGEIEDYLITLKMPGFEESDIDIQVFDGDLIVQAHKDGEIFKRVYDLPEDFEPKGINYKYEDDFLIIKVSLKRKGTE